MPVFFNRVIFQRYTGTPNSIGASIRIQNESLILWNGSIIVQPLIVVGNPWQPLAAAVCIIVILSVVRSVIHPIKTGAVYSSWSTGDILFTSWTLRLVPHSAVFPSPCPRLSPGSLGWEANTPHDISQGWRQGWTVVSYSSLTQNTHRMSIRSAGSEYILWLTCDGMERWPLDDLAPGERNRLVTLNVINQPVRERFRFQYFPDSSSKALKHLDLPRLWFIRGSPMTKVYGGRWGDMTHPPNRSVTQGPWRRICRMPISRF